MNSTYAFLEMRENKDNGKTEKLTLLQKRLQIDFRLEYKKIFFRRFHSGMLDNVENDQYLKYH